MYVYTPSVSVAFTSRINSPGAWVSQMVAAKLPMLSMVGALGFRVTGMVRISSSFVSG